MLNLTVFMTKVFIELSLFRLYSKRYFDYEIKPIYLRNSPLADTNNVDLNNKVKELLSLKDEPDNSTKLELIKEIDKIVFELYGITEDEIKIIEEANT